MAIEPKNTREHILSLYGHISGVKKNLKHVHEDVEKLGGKIDQIYWVLLTVAGTAVVFVLERMFGWILVVTSAFKSWLNQILQSERGLITTPMQIK